MSNRSEVSGVRGLPRKVRVLVVDDSAFFRRRIADALSESPEIEVVGFAADGAAAVEEARRLRPDVITMDVQMPVLDGISAVRRIMAQSPTRILMFSALTREGARSTLEAMDAGAVDFLPKITEPDAAGRPKSNERLRQRVLALARRRDDAAAHARGVSAEPVPAIASRAVGELKSQPGRYRLVAIGASTGGPVAIQTVLSALPAGFPVPILLVVHMPASFTAAYAERLNGLCRVQVKEAQDGDAVQPGLALLAPGGRQMLVESAAGRSVVRVRDSLPDQIYRPSVDVTFGSAARLYSEGVLAVVLTGMGSDGKQGAKLLKAGGSDVWSQDAASCVVYGMPQAVERSGLSDRVLPLEEIGLALTRAV
jgi:two-component system chemotaxis response regulator CheB